MVQAHAVPEKALHLLPVRGVEARPRDLRGDGALALLGDEIQAHHVLRGLGRGPLGEVDHVHGSAAVAHQLENGLVQRCLPVFVFQRYGTK